MKRPALTKSLALDAFQTHYWLKSELAAFCRRHEISAAGGKLEIAQRIEAFLKNSEPPAPAKAKRPRAAAAAMPKTLSRETVLQPGWRCTEALRAFFERELGPRFHFNGAMRDFVRDGAGRTLGDGIAVWEQSLREPKGSSTIAPQFEFNRHMRAYFKANPGHSHADAVKAWKEAKAKRGTRRRGDA